jgi:shikimate 5-dehydrogenase
MINKYTKLLFSVASNPGNLGSTIYNEVFKHYNTNAIYKPLECKTKDHFPELLRSLKTIGAHGVSVSMPFKELARHLVDAGDFLTSQIGNCNTIRMTDNTCYNTDHYSFLMACAFANENPKSFVIVGNGAMSRTIQFALNNLGHKSVHTLGRNHLYLLEEPVFYQDKHDDLTLINASPIGMEHCPDNVFNSHNLERFLRVIDVVIAKDTNLKKCCEYLDIVYTPGTQIFKHQFMKQFELYFHWTPEWDAVNKIMKENGLE